MTPRNLALVAMSVIVTLGLTACGSAPPQEPAATPAVSAQMIDREVLFGNPSRFQGRLSPDGTQMSFRAPLNGVMNLWVAPAADINAARPITRNTGRGIPSHFWALDSKSVLYIEDQNGDENWHLYRVNLATGQTKDLTPYPGVQAQLIAQREQHPGMAVIGMNDRDERWHDVYLVDINTGARTLLLENNGFARIVVDNDLKVRLGVQQTQPGGANLFKYENNAWVPFIEILAEDIHTTDIKGFTADNKSFYMLNSRGRNYAALTRVNVASGQSTDMILVDNADISDVLIHPRTHEVIAVATSTHRQTWKHIDGRFARDIQILNQQAQGDIEILATTLDGEQWVIYTGPSDGSPRYMVYDRDSQTLKKLFTTQPALDGLPLEAKQHVVIRARDGRDLISYLTLPPGVDASGNGIPTVPQPMVLLVHGGPWSRDIDGYDAEVQWLANRGYAVLQVNFRASTGFGKEHIIAGNRQWAAAMHNDLEDAVAWAVNRRVADSKRIAIMGRSYGGYATLVGLTFTPDLFACGVDIFGPSNLNTLLAAIPPYWEGMRRTLVAAVGDPDTAEGKAMLEKRSPINRVEKISKPLLIGHGANDPRVKQAQSDQIVAAMKEKSIPVTYVLFPDEGHGFQRPENSVAFNAVAENFLQRCLGGRAQPIGDAFKNSSIRVVEGARNIQGVEEALVN
jgi:dipeptidyl aminopeptidase/acylaminoacyl peptidase